MIDKLKFYCQRVLPLVYDDSLSFQELLYKVIHKVNEVIEVANGWNQSIIDAVDAKLEEWLEDGTLADIILDSITNVENRVTVLEGEMDIVRDDLNTLMSAPNIVVIGDSYGTENGSGEGTITPYPVYLQQYLRLDDNHFHGAFRNGSGFANGRFLERLNTLTSSDDVSELYVFGGWNDTESRQSDADVIAGMVSFTEAAHQKFPNAKLYCGILAYGYNVSNTYLNDLAHLARVTYGKCTKYGFDGFLNSFPICLQSFEDFWVDISTTSGASHPSSFGSRIIADRLATLIMTKDCSFFDSLNVTYESASMFTLSEFSFQQSCDGKSVSTSNPGATRFRVEADAPFTLNSVNGGNYVLVGTIKNSLSMFRQYRTTWTCPARLSIDGETGFTDTDVEISLHGKGIFIRNCYGPVSNVTGVYAHPRETITVLPYDA